VITSVSSSLARASWLEEKPESHKSAKANVKDVTLLEEKWLQVCWGFPQEARVLGKGSAIREGHFHGSRI
jgi:hypothetical protein